MKQLCSTAYCETAPVVRFAVQRTAKLRKLSDLQYGVLQSRVTEPVTEISDTKKAWNHVLRYLVRFAVRRTANSGRFQVPERPKELQKIAGALGA